MYVCLLFHSINSKTTLLYGVASTVWFEILNVLDGTSLGTKVVVAKRERRIILYLISFQTDLKFLYF